MVPTKYRRGGKKNRKNQGDYVFQSVIAKYA